MTDHVYRQATRVAMTARSAAHSVFQAISDLLYDGDSKAITIVPCAEYRLAIVEADDGSLVLFQCYDEGGDDERVDHIFVAPSAIPFVADACDRMLRAQASEALPPQIDHEAESVANAVGQKIDASRTVEPMQ